MEYSIKDFFSRCDQIRSFLRIWSHLLKKSFMENVIFCAVINEWTHILEHSSSSIELVFTSQPNLSVESGTQSSLHANCHHQVTYGKFNLEIYYPPPCIWEVWQCKDSNTNLIRRSINQFIKFWFLSKLFWIFFAISFLIKQ